MHVLVWILLFNRVISQQDPGNSCDGCDNIDSEMTPLLQVHWFENATFGSQPDSASVSSLQTEVDAQSDGWFAVIWDILEKIRQWIVGKTPLGKTLVGKQTATKKASTDSTTTTKFTYKIEVFDFTTTHPHCSPPSKGGDSFTHLCPDKYTVFNCPNLKRSGVCQKKEKGEPAKNDEVICTFHDSDTKLYKFNCDGGEDKCVRKSCRGKWNSGLQQDGKIGLKGVVEKVEGEKVSVTVEHVCSTPGC